MFLIKNEIYYNIVNLLLNEHSNNENYLNTKSFIFKHIMHSKKKKKTRNKMTWNENMYFFINERPKNIIKGLHSINVRMLKIDPRVSWLHISSVGKRFLCYFDGFKFN